MELNIVYVYVFDGYADGEFDYVAREYLARHYQWEASHLIEVKIFSATGNSVISRDGIRVQADIAADEVRYHAAALLILPDGDLWRVGEGHRSALCHARSFLKLGLPVLSLGDFGEKVFQRWICSVLNRDVDIESFWDASSGGGLCLYRDARAS